MNDQKWTAGKIIFWIGILSLSILLVLGVFYLYFIIGDNMVTCLYKYLPLDIALLVHITLLGFCLWCVYKLFKIKNKGGKTWRELTHEEIVNKEIKEKIVRHILIILFIILSFSILLPHIPPNPLLISLLSFITWIYLIFGLILLILGALIPHFDMLILGVEISFIFSIFLLLLRGI